MGSYSLSTGLAAKFAWTPSPRGLLPSGENRQPQVMEEVADARPPGAATGLEARLPAPAPRAQIEVWTRLVRRKAQETLYFGDEINSPRTVNLHLCKLHCLHPGPGFCGPWSDIWERLLAPLLWRFLEPNLL